MIICVKTNEKLKKIGHHNCNTFYTQLKSFACNCPLDKVASKTNNTEWKMTPEKNDILRSLPTLDLHKPS